MTRGPRGEKRPADVGDERSFRDAVLSAYGGRCHLPETRLLDAAHSVMDANEELGQPIVSNGLPLSKIHMPPSMLT